MAPSLERRAVALTWTALVASTTAAAIVGVIAHASGWLPPPIVVGVIAPAVGVALAIVVGLVRAVAVRLPAALDGWFARRPVAAVLWGVLAVAAVANTARLGVFMVDRSQTWASMFPPVAELARHECLPAYLRAGELAAEGRDDLWVRADYDPDEGGAAETAIRGMQPRLDDPYEYPPPFAVAARAAIAVSDDYEVLRSGWFGISAAVFFLSALVVGAWLDGRAGATTLLLAPALALSTPVMISWQFGQAHLVVVSASVAALALFARGRTLGGGALLGFAIATKIFPALLLVILAVQRRWRALAATLGAVAALFGLALVVLGWGTMSAFVTEHLPAVASGRAFPNALDNDDNHSVFGLVLKLGRLGFAGMGVTTASRIAWVYGLVALALVIAAARHPRDRAGDAMLWLATLALATLRSPFAPTYTAVTALWLLALWSGVTPRRALTTTAIAIAWILPQGSPPVFGERGNLIASLVPQLTVIAITLAAALRRATPAPSAGTSGVAAPPDEYAASGT